MLTLCLNVLCGEKIKMLKPLSSEEELGFLKENHGGDVTKVFCYLRESFALLQARSQMLFGLATIS